MFRKTLLIITFLMLIVSQVSIFQVEAQGKCYFTFTGDREFRTYGNPMFGGGGGVIQPGETYEIVDAAMYDGLTLYQLQIGPDTTGWIEQITLGDKEGDCDFTFNARMVTAEDFPGVCEVESDTPVMTFYGAQLWELHYRLPRREGDEPILYGGGRTVLNSRNAISGELYSGHAGPYRGVLAISSVKLINCPEIEYTSPVNATALEGTRLWSMPHAGYGGVMADIPAGTVLNVLAGPVLGAITADGLNEDDWYLVRHPELGAGWVWSERVELDGKFPFDPAGKGIALNNARLWSAPDVERGEYIGTIGEGASMILMLGPVQGTIRLDDGLVDDWYYVLSGAQGGWLWAGRIDILPDE